ncbi:DUF3558 domain-containing protein [Amycolatopsis sp.]|jgi:hypothetical protein|uniref:DUF3558 domain-containing protein n=1 Tax=Amycolatopsis sp. TaxID=37632 RepID=UPI002DF74558|nr:DUF3558 domain-containing protein [Amycolatopsis sp.]
MKAMNSFLGQRRMLTLLAILTLFAGAGCTNERGGVAMPSDSASSSATSTTPGSAPADVFGSLKACNVLDKALEGQGFPAAVIDRAGGDNGCDTLKSGFGTMSLDLHPNLGIDDLNAAKSKQFPGEVNDRRSIQVRDGIGSRGNCDIALEVTKTSRAIVGVTLTTGTTEEACAFVYSIAKKVEPQLPKGN